MRKCCFVLLVVALLYSIPVAWGQGNCTQLYLTEYLDSSSYSSQLTISGEAMPSFLGLTSAVLPVDDAYHGNNTIGHETLRFVFADGSFDLEARYTVQGDIFTIANVNGAGTVKNGTGVFQDVSGHLMYHGLFTVGATDFTFLDVFYAGNICMPR